jgi:hypothetical protein
LANPFSCPATLILANPWPGLGPASPGLPGLAQGPPACAATLGQRKRAQR